MKSVPVPTTLTDRQIELAQAYTQAKHDTGITVGDFCSNNKLSSATWAKWVKDEVFNSYLVALGGAITPTDKWVTFEIVQRRIEQLASARNAGIKELEMYLKTNDHMLQAYRQKQMTEMGITPAHDQVAVKTIDERKAAILGQLHEAPPPYQRLRE